MKDDKNQEKPATNDNYFQELKAASIPTVGGGFFLAYDAKTVIEALTAKAEEQSGGKLKPCALANGKELNGVLYFVKA